MRRSSCSSSRAASRSSEQRYGDNLPEITLKFDPETRTITAGPTRQEADQQAAEDPLLDYLRGIDPTGLRRLERAGRIPPARRDESGQRGYSHADVEVVRRVLFGRHPESRSLRAESVPSSSARHREGGIK